MYDYCISGLSVICLVILCTVDVSRYRAVILLCFALPWLVCFLLFQLLLHVL
jgi:hypothetical protein